jgi:hydroxymethylpyrimidine/phosphomethylpyrimidine kinase
MKVVLSIAGSDCSGGAGIQADLKTFESFGVFGTSVITVLTAQNTQGVDQVSEIPCEFVKAQLDSIFNDFDIAAIKIGMLFSNDIINTVREYIKNINIPIIFDPVFISKAGSKLLNDDAILNMKSILPYCTLTTPNLFEAKEMFEYEFSDLESFKKVYNAPCKVLIKNHNKVLESNIISIDILYDNQEKYLFDTPYLKTQNTHGTGCSFSSAIAANLALGNCLEDSIRISKNFIYLAIKNAPNLGDGKGPIAHKIGGELCLKYQN